MDSPPIPTRSGGEVMSPPWHMNPRMILWNLLPCSCAQGSARGQHGGGPRGTYRPGCASTERAPRRRPHLVVQRRARHSGAALASAQLSEVLARLGANVAEELDHDPARGCTRHGNVQKHLRALLALGRRGHVESKLVNFRRSPLVQLAQTIPRAVPGQAGPACGSL